VEGTVNASARPAAVASSVSASALQPSEGSKQS
jgi:hypothetical protein